MIILIFLVLILLMFLSVPVAFSIITAVFVYLFATGNIPLTMPAHQLAGSLDSFLLLAVPMFLLSAKLASTGGLTKRLFEFARSLVGFIPGGLGHVNIVTSIIFAGMSGSAVADTAGPGYMATEIMRKQGFGYPFSAAVTIASSTIGPIIPPSVPIVIYASMAGVSVGALFLAGIIPGLLMGIVMMILVYWISIRRRYPYDRRIDVGRILKTAKGSFLALLAPVILLGSIYSGIATPTEAAAICATYVFIIEVFVYKDITTRQVVRLMAETAIQLGSIMLICGAAFVLSWVMGFENIPVIIADTVLGITNNLTIIFLGILAILLFLGFFMEGVSVMILLLPVLLPLLIQFDVNLVHFGIIMCLAITLGVMTPPFGMCLFVLSGVTGLSIEEISKELIPFLIILIIVLLAITFIPKISLLLPNLLGY